MASYFDEDIKITPEIIESIREALAKGIKTTSIPSAPPGFKASYCGKPVITLRAEATISDSTATRIDAASLDFRLKEELAYRIAKQLVDEDLIDIKYDHDIMAMESRLRATIKVVQE